MGKILSEALILEITRRTVLAMYKK